MRKGHDFGREMASKALSGSESAGRRSGMAGLKAAAASGDRPQTLAELRDLLAAHLETAPPSYVAGLSKQLAEVMRELHDISPPAEVSAVDEIATARARRRAATKVPKRRTRGSK
jgi:hypothetical protein